MFVVVSCPALCRTCNISMNDGGNAVSSNMSSPDHSTTIVPAVTGTAKTSDFSSPAGDPQRDLSRNRSSAELEDDIEPGGLWWEHHMEYESRRPRSEI